MFIKPFFIICKVTNTQICQKFEICSSFKIFVLEPGIGVLLKCQHMILLLHSANYTERNEYFQFKEKTFCMRVTLNC